MRQHERGSITLGLKFPFVFILDFLLYLTALQSLDSEEAEYVTGGTVQEISFHLDKYLGAGCDRAALQKRMLSRISELTSFQAFPPDIPADAPFEKFENTTAGQHSLATVRLLNLSKYSAKATLVICAGRITVTAAIEANLYQAALRDSLPSIRLSRASPGDLKS
jgi:hypothetical protein